MLAYLEALRDALIARDGDAIRRLLAHPLAGALPDPVRSEAARILAGTMPAHSVPIAALQLYHQTAHCLGVAREDRAVGREAPRERPRRVAAQMELPLQVA